MISFIQSFPVACLVTHWQCGNAIRQSEATQARAAKSKATKKDKAKLRQAKAAAKQAKKDLSELSQKLVLELVNMIEDENMLKPAMSLYPTYESGSANSESMGATTDSGNIGVPDIVPNLQ